MIILPKTYNINHRPFEGKQPVGQAYEIDWENPLTRDLVGFWVMNGISREYVTDRSFLITGTDYQIEGDVRGRRIDFGNNNNSTWFEVSLSESQPYLIGTGDFSYGSIMRIQPDTIEQTLFQIGRGQAGGERFSVFLNTNERWDGELDDDVVRSDFNFNSALPLNQRSVLAITGRRTSVVRGYIDGIFDGSASISASQGNINDADHGVHIGYNQELNIGSRDNISSSEFELAVLWHRELSTAEVQSFNRNPYQVLKPKMPTVYFRIGARVGTIDQTLENITSTASGLVSAIGTLSETLDNIVSTASGQVGLDVTGTVSETLDNITLTASGTVGSGVSGTVAETLDNITSTASGIVDLLGSLSETLDDITSTATGTVGAAPDVTGTLSETLADITAVATGLVGIQVSGSLVEFLDPITLTASGLVGNVIGTADVTLENITSTAIGTVSVVGTANITLGDITSIALAEAPAITIQDIRLKSTLMAILANQSIG